MVKLALIQSSNFNPENYSDIIRKSFADIIRDGIHYKKISTFEHYINEHFDYVFDTPDDYEKWLVEFEWRYFLIPLELVPNISHYSNFVKETFPNLIFDVVLEKQTVNVEGVDVDVPTNSIKMIPCNCTHWTDEGLMLLDAVIENWNVSNPNKPINFQVKFESFNEFKNFRDEQIQV